MHVINCERLTDASLHAIAESGRVQYLELGDTFTDAGLVALGRLRLRELTLFGNDDALTDAGFIAIAKGSAPTLERLGLYLNKFDEDSGWPTEGTALTFVEHCHNLRSLALNLPDCTCITPRLFSAIAHGLPQLTELNIKGGAAEDCAPAIIECINCLRHLTTLKVQGGSLVNEATRHAIEQRQQTSLRIASVWLPALGEPWRAL